jgi:hypothetical protein
MGLWASKDIEQDDVNIPYFAQPRVIKPLETALEMLLPITDIDFHFHQEQTDGASTLCYTFSELSVKIRTHNKKTDFLQFLTEPYVPSGIQIDQHGTRISDNESNIWHTVRMNKNLKHGDLYFFEIKLVKMKHKFIMIGFGFDDQSYPTDDCLGIRFYAVDYRFVSQGSTLGFICDIRESLCAKLYLIVDGTPKGRVFEQARKNDDLTLFPVISLACGGNVVRINNAAKFPRCDWEKAARFFF